MSDPTASAHPTPRVVLLNGDGTPMEFVVHVLETFFDLDREDATRLMLTVHQAGSGVAGRFPQDVAEAKAAEVIKRARQHGHPLQCVVESMAY